jgi:hypothetical protein
VEGPCDVALHLFSRVSRSHLELTRHLSLWRRKKTQWDESQQQEPIGDQKGELRVRRGGGVKGVGSGVRVRRRDCESSYFYFCLVLMVDSHLHAGVRGAT